MKKVMIACLAALIALGGSAVLARAGSDQEAHNLRMSQVPPAVQKGHQAGVGQASPGCP